MRASPNADHRDGRVGHRRSVIGLALLIFAIGVSRPHAFETYRDTIAGPVEARVVKVRDGDTVEVEAFVWPQQVVHVAVRLKGIDAPEHSGKCPAEKRAAAVAKARLTELVGDGAVRLTAIAGGKYYGRVLADLSTRADGDLGAILLREGLVARYKGGTRRDWCAATLSGVWEFVHPTLSGVLGRRG